MHCAFLSLLLSIQILCTGGHDIPAGSIFHSHLTGAPRETYAQSPLWWGLIDPELSTWFARLPLDDRETDAPILWDWSWRGFLAALWGMPTAKEAPADAASI